MRTGVYIKRFGRTGVGQFYSFDLHSRDHDTGEELVTYTPLRVERDWEGTVRHCTISRTRFEEKFEWIGEGLPVAGDPRWPDKVG